MPGLPWVVGLCHRNVSRFGPMDLETEMLGSY